MLGFEESEHFWKMIKINTKVLILSKFYILADFSQNMGNLEFNVIRIAHNIGPEDENWRFTENQHFSVDFRRIWKWPTRGSVIFGGFVRISVSAFGWYWLETIFLLDQRSNRSCRTSNRRSSIFGIGACRRHRVIAMSRQAQERQEASLLVAIGGRIGLFQ